VLFLLAHVVTFRLTAVVLDRELERLSLRAFLESLEAARIHHKEACDRLGIAKSQWSEICSGQRHTPSHTRMLNLGTSFWMEYLPRIAAVVIRRDVTAHVEDAQIRRVS